MTSTTVTARPRFRTDLVAEPIQDGNQRFIDVFDPDSGRGFRFYEVEYAMACAMDGERDVAGLARWAREELGVEPKPGELTRVISTLGELGYLAGERTDVGELAAGVVAGRAPVAPSVEPLELGTAGATPQARVDELPRAPELELGQAGGVSSPRIVVDDFGAGPDLSARDEFPIPPPAVEPVAALQRRTVPDAGLEHDGPTDLPRPVPLAAGDDDVSTDLSDHLAISASDVKEAVRASRVMQAVELPADIAATLAAAEAEQEARSAADKAAAEKAAAEQAAAQQAAEQAQREAEARLAAEKAAAEQAAAEKAAAERAAAEAAERAAAEKAAAEKAAAEKAAAEKAALLVPADKAADKAVDKKPADKAADKKPADTGTAKLPPKDKGTATTAVEPPEPRTSRALIFLLVLTILLAGTYLVWTQILKKPLPWEKAEPTTTAAAPTAPTPPPAPPAPPPPPTATLAEAPGATTDVAAGRQGTVVEVVADGSAVAAGDLLARFQSPPALGKKLATARKRLDVELPRAITELTAKRDAAKAASKADALKTWQERLDKQEQARTAVAAEVAALTTQLDAFTVKAPLAGTVKTQVAKGAKVSKDEQVLASITAPTMLTAMITVTSGTSYQVGDSVQVVPQAADGVAAAFAIACKVGEVQGLVVTVVCPPGGPLAPGSTITLP